MSPFRVWIDPLGDFCRVRVEGTNNAHWLLARLSREFVFKTIAAMKTGTSCCQFQVAYSSCLSPEKFELLLAAIPSVQLSMEVTEKVEVLAG